MNETSPAAEARTPLMDRPVRLKVVLIIAAVLIVAAAVVLLIQALNSGQRIRTVQEELRDSAEAKASVLAHAVAVFGNKMITAREYNRLQEYADSLIAAKGADDILYVAVVDMAGNAVVHTDRRYRGRPFEPEAAEAGALRVAAADSMDLTKKVATVYVGVQVR